MFSNLYTIKKRKLNLQQVNKLDKRYDDST